MFAYGFFTWDVFLVDDNVCQWFPVIEKAYEQFLCSGHMPSYDFFQTKGLPIAYMGYYSLYNPLMLISYVLSHYCFIPFNTIAIYICILSGFGNVFVFGLCRIKGLKCLDSVLCVLAYSSSACFVAFHNWYYVFNNYFIVPLLIYSILVNKKGMVKYFNSGAILAFSLFMGNVQYTFYHYICYSIFVFTFILLSTKKLDWFKLYISNTLCGVALSLPLILMGLNASSSFGKKSMFLVGSIDPLNLIISSFFSFFVRLPLKPFNHNYEYSAAVMLPFIVGGVFLIYRTIIQKRIEKKYYELWAFFVVSVFWLSFLDSGAISNFLSVCPIIGKFRFLFKGLFILIPLMGVFLVFLIPCLSQNVKKLLLSLVAFFSLLGIVNNFTIYDDTRSLFIADKQHYTKDLYAPELVSKINQYGIDKKNFRIASFFSNGSISIDKMYFDKALNRNYPTFLGAFSLSGYEIASPQNHLNQFDKIYSNLALLTIYGNNGVNLFLARSIENESVMLEKQLKDNSVKYLLIQNDLVYSIDFFVKKINLFDSVYVDYVKKWEDDFTLISLGSVPSLCFFNDSANVPLQTQYMDLLSFKANESGKYTLSFSYEDKLVAKAVNDENNEENLEIQEDLNGNVEIFCKKGQQISVTYKEPLAILAQILEIITTGLFLFITIKVMTSKDEIPLC
jgi:hypothetical protein